MVLENTDTFPCTLRLSCTSHFSRIIPPVECIKLANFLLIMISFDHIELFFKKKKKNYTMLDYLCDLLMSVLGRIACLQYSDGAGLFCTSLEEFGKVIRLESSRDPVGWPVVVVSPGSTRQVWSSPWLLSLVVLSKAFVAVCICTKD